MSLHFHFLTKDFFWFPSSAWELSQEAPLPLPWCYIRKYHETKLLQQEGCPLADHA
jgi:hypothetical protein